MPTRQLFSGQGAGSLRRGPAMQGDIDQRDDDAAYVIVRRAIGQHADHVPAPILADGPRVPTGTSDCNTDEIPLNSAS